jgi:MFS family permease
VTEHGQDRDDWHASWLMTQQQLDRVINADRRRSRAASMLTSAACVLTAAGLAVGAMLTDRWAHGAPAAAALIVAAFCALSSVIAPLVLGSMQRTRARRWRQRQRECQELAAIISDIRDPALGKLVSFNFRLMDRFVAVALGQARASFVACCVAGAAALLVLLAGTATVLAAHGTGTQATAGGLTVAGAALSGFLGVTFLRTFEMTSRQMSYYYGQPLVHCYLLHGEWLAERFEKGADPDAVWQMRHELIRAAINAGHNAQNHLLDLQKSPRVAGGLHDGAAFAVNRPQDPADGRRDARVMG